MYHYSASLIKVIDGDTLDLFIDLGFGVITKQRVRLAAINTPELPTEAGKAAKEFLQAMLENKLLTVITSKDRKEKYGRYLATLYVNDLCVNDYLVQQGHATKYVA